MKIHNIRKEYSKHTLSIEDLAENPFKQFEKWFFDFMDVHKEDANVMVLSTANKKGQVSSRAVLLKDFSEDGFIFFTNYNSRKARDIQENPYASLLFISLELERQIRIEGKIRKTSKNISDQYFFSRPLENQLAAIVSPQSSKINSKEELIKQFNELKNLNLKLKRPSYWGGYILKPYLFEFWQGGIHRLHDRFQYKLTKKQWKIYQLAP